MAAADQVSSIDDVFRDPPSLKKTSLVHIHEGVEVMLKPRGQDLSDSLHEAALARDRPEVRGGGGRIDFREKNKEGPIDAR